LGPSGELGVDSRAAQEIERKHGLGNKAIPQVEGKELVHAAETRDEMVFEGSDGAFGGVSTVDAGRRKLEVDVLLAEELL
jgi:hypothetical protein